MCFSATDPTYVCRSGESASTGLTEALQRLGYETGRLKTGTPARVDKRTVDFSSLEEQPGVCVCGEVLLLIYTYISV